MTATPIRDRGTALPATRFALLALALLGWPAPAPAQDTACLACHEELHPELVEQAAEGVHFEVDLSCHDCHGGNPDPALGEDMEASMDPDHGPNPYRGAPTRTEVPAFCGRCHADTTFMKRYVADPRVDQLREYRTSGHGRALEAGDPNVATCVDCHRVHGVRRVDAPESAVYPTRVAETCARCHADPERMAGYQVDGRAMPTDQYADWKASVHAHALLEGGQLSAPTCNDCHGDHGATPPGVETISRVCGHCHAREAELFRSSPKHEGFAEHRGFLAEAGEAGCDACHGAADRDAVDLATAFTECETCHGNHRVARPTVRMLGVLPPTPCDFCHAPPQAGDTGTLAEMRRHYFEVRTELIARAPMRSGPELFAWLARQARSLPAHTRPASEAEGGGRVLEDEVARLYEKLRIGPLVDDDGPPPARCDGCHAADPEMGDPIGLQTARTMVEGMEALSRTTAQAQRVMLRAQRGGVLVGDAQAELDGAVEAGIQLEVLVHTFQAGEGTDFRKHLEAGLQHADAALEAGSAALDELAWRRRGLFVFLGIVLVLLVALILRIRQRAATRGPPDREVAGS